MIFGTMKTKACCRKAGRKEDDDEGEIHWFLVVVDIRSKLMEMDKK